MQLYDTLKADANRCGVKLNLLRMIRLYLAAPGFKLLLGYRLANISYSSGWRRLALVLRNRYHRITSCDISERAYIGPGCYFPHATGIVIGEGVEIGCNATIYHHVTLGRRDLFTAGYPRVGDDVIIYAGACIVGAVTIGNGARVLAHAIVSSDVGSGEVVK